MGDVGHHSSQTMQSVRHGPGQAAPAIVERRADADRVLARPSCSLLGDVISQMAPVGQTWRAEDAVRLAVADARHEHRRPEALDAALEERPDAARCWGTPSCSRRSGCSGRGNATRRATPGGRMRNVPAGVLTPGRERRSGTIADAGRHARDERAPLDVRASRASASPATPRSTTRSSMPAGRAVGRRSSCRGGTRPCARPRPGSGRRRPGSGAGSAGSRRTSSSCLRSCTSDQREQTPSSAPSGQIARHQKRVTRLLSDQHERRTACR